MTRKPIHQLSPALVNRIAAGEVIERPASVVKELVENSLDAGATSITVDIEDGGRELIRVTDDGSGIPPGELPLAWASHATSKLLSDEDLFRIDTKGFRGEALASIGSVSHARILSRTRDSDAAYEITNRGGVISDVQAASGNVGTTIDVRNLFFNVPARRKFMKGTGTEFGHIGEMLLRLALAHPAVHLRLTHNARKVADYAPTTPVERLLTAWPDDFRELRLSVDARDAEVRLWGIIGLPELARPTQKYQHLYLNGRPIRDRFIQHALREAYRGLTEPGRHPAAVLLLEIPPGDVDVNVHPTKSEVRFKDSGRLHGLVHSAVRETLLGSDLTPRAVPAGGATLEEAPRTELRQKLANFFREAPPATANASEGKSFLPPLPKGESSGAGFQEFTSFLHSSSPANATPTLPISPASSSTYQPDGESFSSLGISQGPLPNPLPRGEGTGRAWSHDLQPPSVPAIQLHNSYLVAQSEDGLVIIDQHALHERIIFEELLSRFTRGPLEAQRLLIPLTLPASASQMDLLEQIQPLLLKLGIEAGPFGPNTLAVQAFPSFLEKLDPVDFLQELLERGEQELLDLNEEEMLHEVLDMMSCKAAVKAGDFLTPPEIEALLARRDLVERSSNCPHGRPTTLRLSLRDLEKQFKRTGF